MSGWISASLLPLSISWALIFVLRRARWTQRLEDQPNERSLHAEPRRRVGGIALLCGALPVAAFHGDAAVQVCVACAAALGLISFADDVRSLPIQVRLPAHLAAAGVALLAMGSPHFAIPFALAAVVGIAWMTNLFNFMDGADGLAGGMAAIGFTALSLGAAHSGATPLALACCALASASVGFLLHNFPPARVFLGDAGSIPLGFLAGALGVYGVLASAWEIWFPILVFSPFVVDATFTLLKRALRREPVWKAHRSHVYQGLVLAGWSHARLALVSYALMAAVGVSAAVAQRADRMLQCGIILVWVVAYLLLLAMSGRFLRPNGSDPRKSPEQPVG